MKKKILALCLVIALAVTAVTGVTLAYFTDVTEEKVNTFTSGKVDITLEENFVQGSKLLPGPQNSVKKEVWIELADGSEDSYVWYEWLIPTELDSTDGSTGTNNFVHVNSYGRTWDTYRENEAYWAEGQTEALPLEQTWDHAIKGSNEGFIGKENIDGVEYNKYVALYHGVLSHKEDGQTETSVAMSKVYLDAAVNTTANGDYVKGDKVVSAELLKGFSIIVKAYAIQADGFDDVYAAYDAYQAQK